MSRAYVKLNNVEYRGIATVTRSTSFNSQVEVNLDGGRTVDIYNGVNKKSWILSFVTRSESELKQMESELVAIGQQPVSLDLEDEAGVYLVIINNGSLKIDVTGAYFNGEWNKGAGTINFGVDEI